MPGALTRKPKKPSPGSNSVRINLRMDRRDLEAVRARARLRGVGYQTLIASIVRMHVNDELLEIGEVKKLAKAGLLKSGGI